MAEIKRIEAPANHPFHRRSSSRIRFFSMARFRPADAGPAGQPWLCATKDFSRNSVYFVANDHALCESALLVLRFPYHLQPSVRDCEYLVEIKRINSLPRGRCGIGARLVPRIPLKLHDGFLVMDTGFAQSIWRETDSRNLDVYV